MFNNGWDDILADVLESNEFKSFLNEIYNDYENHTVFPPKDQLFEAFNLTDYKDVKLVILGQDPYYQEGQANGLAFSVNKGVKLPPSLRNIFKEIERDLNISNTNGDLSPWARQGVFLLNTILTSRQGQANYYKNTYWEKFTDIVINRISQKGNLVFLLFGRQAQDKKKLIEANNIILETSHPSPLGAYRGFNQSGIFSKANEELEKLGKDKIDWRT